MLSFKPFVILAALGLVASAAILPRQSTTPCGYICPTTNIPGHSYKERVEATAAGMFLCRYYTTPSGLGECWYSYSTGSKVAGSGFCYTAAVLTGTCTSRRKARELFDARARKTRGELSEEVKDIIEKRKNLGNSKHIASE